MPVDRSGHSTTTSTGAGESLRDGPGDFWLRHVFPERHPIAEPWRVTLDDVQMTLEERISWLADGIHRHHGVPRERAAAQAASLVTNECLALHRAHSPLGHRAVVTNLMASDPMLQHERDRIAERARAGRRRAALAGIGVGAAVSTLVYLVCDALR